MGQKPHIKERGEVIQRSHNVQSWIFGAVMDAGLRKQISELAGYGKFIKDCAACFAVFANSTTKYFLEDGSAATENILLACTAHGIGSCWYVL